MNDNTYKLLKDWFKPRTVIACAFYATFLYLILAKTEIPAPLNTIVSNLFGYWFGSKTAKEKNKGE